MSVRLDRRAIAALQLDITPSSVANAILATPKLKLKPQHLRHCFPLLFAAFTRGSLGRLSEEGLSMYGSLIARTALLREPPSVSLILARTLLLSIT